MIETIKYIGYALTDLQRGHKDSAARNLKWAVQSLEEVK